MGSSVIAAALGAPEAVAEADADAYYGGVYGLGYGGLHGLGYARGYGYGPGIAHHGSGHSYVHQGIQGLGHYGYGKREAEATPEAAAEAEATPAAEADADAHYGYYGYGGYGRGVARHPYGYARSFVGPTTYGYPAYGYGHGLGYGYGHGYGHFGKRSAEPHGVVALAPPVGVAGSPGLATSYVGRTVFGYPGGLH